MPAVLAGLHSEGGLRALDLRGRVVGRAAAADVTVDRSGRAPVRFILRRTTAADSLAFAAPPGAWRIASGAIAVLRS
jgi:hypothetical protein